MNFKKCPFCGRKQTVRLQTASEYEEQYWNKTLDSDEQYQVVCDVNKSGCGSSTGFYDSEEEAVNIWNTRVNDQVP